MLPLDFWQQFWPQFWANFIGGAIIVAIAVWIEAILDERGRVKHDRQQRRREKHPHE